MRRHSLYRHTSPRTSYMMDKVGVASMVVLLLSAILHQHMCDASPTYTDRAVGAGTSFSNQITATTLGVGDWSGSSHVVVLGDLDGDTIDEIALGNVALRRVLIVKLASKDAKDADKQHAFAIPAPDWDPGIGTQFGKSVTPLRYDYDFNGINDIAIGAPTKDVTASGRLMIALLNDKLGLIGSKVYTAAEWCPGCSVTPFAYAVISWRYWGTYCLSALSGLTIAGGSNWLRCNCGITAKRPDLGITFKAESRAMTNSVGPVTGSPGASAETDYLYPSIMALGDANGDSMEEVVRRNVAYNSGQNKWTYSVAIHVITVGFTITGNAQAGPFAHIAKTSITPFTFAAPGDVSGDGVPDLAYTDGVKFYFMLVSSSLGLLSTASSSITLPDGISYAFAFSRVGGFSSLYAYYINTAGNINGLDVGGILPKPTETNPVPTPPYIDINFMGNLERERYTYNIVGEATAPDKTATSKTYWVGDITGDGWEEFAFYYSDKNALYFVTPSVPSDPYFKLTSAVTGNTNSANFGANVMPTNVDFNNDGANDVAVGFYTEAAGFTPAVWIVCFKPSPKQSPSIDLVTTTTTYSSPYTKWTGGAADRFGQSATYAFVSGEIYLLVAQQTTTLLAAKAADILKDTIPVTTLTSASTALGVGQWGANPNPIQLTPIGDLNADAVDEFAAIGTLSTTYFVSILFYNPKTGIAGGIKKHLTNSTSVFNSFGAVGDLDSNGVPDLVVAVNAGMLYALYLNSVGENAQPTYIPRMLIGATRQNFGFISASRVTHTVMYSSITQNIGTFIFPFTHTPTATSTSSPTPTLTPTASATATLTPTPTAVERNRDADPNYCQWFWVGFNPWVRWNVFVTEGLAVFDSSVVKGRVAGVGAIEIKNGAAVHTEQQTQYVANRIQWSATSNEQVTVVGATIYNGGVEARVKVDLQAASDVRGAVTCVKGPVTMADASVKGSVTSRQGLTVVTGAEPVQGASVSETLSLSADLVKAKAYFAKRSEAYRSLRLAPSNLGVNATASELTVRLHGRLNVIESIDLTGINRIVLLGHPSGVLIINALGTDVTLANIEVVYKNIAQPPTPVTFGRVLLNFPDATKLQLNAMGDGETVPVTLLSILAPHADVTFASGIVKGNLVAKSLATEGGAEIHSLAWGTPERRETRPPRPHKPPVAVQRALSFACLWGAM